MLCLRAQRVSLLSWRHTGSLALAESEFCGVIRARFSLGRKKLLLHQSP